MRQAITVGLMIAIMFPLVGCASPTQRGSASVRQSQYPYDLVLPSDVIPVFL
jgi:hypothetical protein